MLAALLPAACVTAPPPPPPPPFLAWHGQEPLPAPADDIAYVEQAAASRGHSLTPSELRYNLISLALRRIEAADGLGYSTAYRDDAGNWFVNVKPPYDRAAILALANETVRAELTLREVRFDAQDIERIQQRLLDAFTGNADVSMTMYDHLTDMFVLGVEEDADLDVLRARIPPDLQPFVRIEPGNTIILV